MAIFVNFFGMLPFCNFLSSICHNFLIQRTKVKLRPLRQLAAGQKERVGLPNPLYAANPLGKRFGEVPDFDLVLCAVPFHSLLVAFGTLARALILVILLSLHFFISFPFLIIVQHARAHLSSIFFQKKIKKGDFFISLFLHAAQRVFTGWRWAISKAFRSAAIFAISCALAVSFSSFSHSLANFCLLIPEKSRYIRSASF